MKILKGSVGGTDEGWKDGVAWMEGRGRCLGLVRIGSRRGDGECVGQRVSEPVPVQLWGRRSHRELLEVWKGLAG